MTPEKEALGKHVFENLMREAQNLTMTDILILRSAWKGKLRWEEMPDDLREAFARAGNLRDYVFPNLGRR